MTDRRDNAPPPDGWRPVLIERHRDNCTLIDCRICTPHNVSRGEN